MIDQFRIISKIRRSGLPFQTHVSFRGSTWKHDLASRPGNFSLDVIPALTEETPKKQGSTNQKTLEPTKLDDDRYSGMAVIEENQKQFSQSIAGFSKTCCQSGTGRKNFLDGLIARGTRRHEEAWELGKINIPLAADFGYILGNAELPTRLASVSPICKMGMISKVMKGFQNQFRK